MVAITLRCLVLASLVWVGTLLVVPTARAAENDFKVIDGTVMQSLVLPGDVVAQLSGPDGAIYYIDFRPIGARLAPEPYRIEARTMVTVAGYEGQRPDQITAHTLQVRDPAPLPPPEPRRSVDLRVLEGVVQSVTRRVLQLRTTDGRTMAVRIGNAVSSAYPFLRGDKLKVLGVLTTDEVFAASAVVQDRSSLATAVDPAGYGP